jgi:UPF0271 protein
MSQELQGCLGIGQGKPMRVDLNGDVGESFGAYRSGQDELLLPFLSSASVACGFHAGDPRVMRTTVALAKAHGVAVGAHPGFPDLVGFGRRNLAASPQEIEDDVTYQIGALMAVAARQGVRLRHVKPHGALYNLAAVQAEVADAVARATASIDPSLMLFGLSGSELIAAARRHGLRGVSEVFADRAYQPDGSLVPRTQAGAVIHEPARVVARAVQMAATQTVEANDGTTVALVVDTLCVHGDTPGAADLARVLREALRGGGVRVEPIGGV